MSLILAQGGKTQYVIIKPENASPTIAYAAEELARFLCEISGANFPIYDDTRSEKPCEIVLGAGKRTAVISKRLACGPEGFAIKTVFKKLHIAGGDDRGTLYGVYAFLEEHLGCHWFTPEVSVIPKRDCVEIPALSLIENPVLEYREPFYFEAFDGDWAARNRCNSNSARLTEKHGGKVKYGTFVHTFNYLVPPDEYFDKHPEYFSEINGKRTNDHTQLCLTNPDVLRISKERVREWIKANPDATIFSVSQNDHRNPCQCAKCKAIDDAEGGHAGTLLRFVNAIAEDIEKDYPHVSIDTLAYQYTRPAPRITKPRKNVIVRLCSIECCFTHPLGKCTHVREAADPNRPNDFLTDLADWAKISDRLYIWDYVTNFRNYLLPYPNTEILKDNVNFFVNHSVKGIFEEGAYQSNGSYCAELNSYVLAKVLWNPAYDDKKAVDEFCTGVYGMAGPTMKRIFSAYRKELLREKYHLTFSVAADSILKSQTFVKKISRMFDEAEMLADNESVLKQVRKARLWQRYLEICRIPLEKPGRNEIIDAFAEDCRVYGVNHLREGSSQLDEHIARLKENR